MDAKFRWLRYGAIGLAALILVAVLIVHRLWQDRDAIEDIGWPTAPVASEPSGAVTVTWLGITTLLFDDGETQILIDGAFTRVSPWSIALYQSVSSDVATINYALATFRMDRLAAIIPVHSHFDHAMDVGHVANRTSALVLGSESTANIARGAKLPVDQYQILADGETRQFGDFTIRLVASKHAPVGGNDEEIFPGIIDEVLEQPVRVSAMKTGVAWNVFVSHPRGTTLVAGSAGYIEGKLADQSADVVMLGIAGLAGLGKAYTTMFWKETVTATGAARVIAIHHDDFTAPFGEVRLFSKLLDDVVTTAGWINQRRAGEQEPKPTVELPPFGQPVALY